MRNMKPYGCPPLEEAQRVDISISEFQLIKTSCDVS
jgi:hypothetical protein